MSETIKEKIQAPYKFTERETCELARKLAHANQRKAELGKFEDAIIATAQKPAIAA